MTSKLKSHCITFVIFITACNLLVSTCSAQSSENRQSQNVLMSVTEREKLNLQTYIVQNEKASFLDVKSRIDELSITFDQKVYEQKVRLPEKVSCTQFKSIETPSFKLRIPAYYDANEEWSKVSHLLFSMEDAVSNLSGAFIATGNDYFSTCLLEILNGWATENSLVEYQYNYDDRQAWFSLEATYFAIALSYSVIKQVEPIPTKTSANIEKWLNQLAHTHISQKISDQNFCCNNHFYRRALFATIIGVITEDDLLFQYGISAIYSALYEMTAEGAFPREMERGYLAFHYQNYALLYLIPIMHIVNLQGYDLFNLEYNGNTMEKAVNFFLNVAPDDLISEKPPVWVSQSNMRVDYAPQVQKETFLYDKQYYAWMEIWLLHKYDPDIDNLVSKLRPIYNRSMMGHVTLALTELE